MVGVEGWTLIGFLGERGDLSVMEDMEAEEVEEALEWVLLWKLRTEETDDEVEFRLPRPRPEWRR